MEATHPLLGKVSRFICTLTMLMCMAACLKGQPPCTGPYNAAGILPVTTEGYGCGATLNPAQYNQMNLRPGEHVKLLFACSSVTVNPYVLSDLAVTSVSSGGMTTVTITVQPTVPAGTQLTVPFSSPAYNFKITVAKNVWPGDANADGRRNMHDLMPIALGIRRNITGPVPPAALLYPPQISQMKNFVQVADWDSSFKVGPKTINFKHADCNLDGFINEEDIEYLLAVLTPASPPNYLLDVVQDLQIQATYDTTTGLEVVINDDASMGLRVPFNIKVADPGMTFMDPIFGVSFTRPVTETDTYTVASTHFVFPIPNLWSVMSFPGDVMLWEQHFWNKIGIVHKGEDCATIIDKPLDVGVYKKTGNMAILPAASSARVGNCQVTLLEILSVANPTPPPFTLYQHLLNGIAYTMNNNNLTPVALECSSDNTIIDPESLLCNSGFRRQLLIRDGAGDNGQVPSDSLKGWNSPDIWVRTNPDGNLVHQDPSPGLPAHIYVRVLNPSCSPMDSFRVKIYAAIGKVDHWSSDFTLVGTVNLPTIAAWDNTIQQVTYNFPTVGNPNYNPAYTLWAIVEPIADTAILFVPLAELVRGSSTWAMRTGRVLKAGSAAVTPIRFALPTWIDTTSTALLRLTQADGSISHPASSYGSIQLVFYDCTPSNPIGMNPITAPPGAAAAYELQGLEGVLTLANITSTTPYVGISYVAGPTSPAGSLAYRFLLQYQTGMNYPGQSFSLSIP